VANLRDAVFGKAMSLHLGYFSNERKGNIISRLTSDVQEVEYSIANSFTVAFREPVTLIGYFVALFMLSVKLTLFTLLVIPVSGIVIAAIVKRLRKSAREGQESLSRLMSILDETFGGMRVVMAFNAANYLKEKFSQENMRYKHIVLSMAKKRELSSPFSEFTGVFVVVGILLYGGSLVLSNQSELNAAQFITYIAIFSQVLRPAKEISNAFSNIQRGLAAGDRIFTIIDTESAIQNKPGAVSISTFQDSIEFKNVYFAYENDNWILKNISIKIPKGRTIALVGPSGGGKSTFADMVPRFYDPTKGQVLIDGKDLRECNIESIRRQMGIVTQESILFNDSIYNNIAFGRETSEEEVVMAAKIANAHSFIMDTSDGYQTMIGDRGTKLSGGQRQRISIARAVLKNPSILILDEATSALDTESEKLVQEALNNLMKNRTSLVIAHRLSTIQHADEILVIQNGQIVERGNHEDLLEVENGVYKKLNMMQML
jgi:subfamily B ATP-binding cassette protein MsbA